MTPNRRSGDALPLPSPLRSRACTISSRRRCAGKTIICGSSRSDRYGDPDPEYQTNPPTQRAVGVKLAALIARRDLAFSYIYDFGDNWSHTVQVEGVEPAQSHAPYPHFIEGSRRCPPEDVGGTPGFEGFLEAVTTARHPERRTLLDWYGGPYDPKDINRQMIEYRFAQIAKRRMKPGPR